MSPFSSYCTSECLTFLQLQKLTVPVLKEYLKSVGVKPAGKKQDLIDSIKEHLGI